MKRGRPSVYTQEIAGEICERLANGESLRSICSEDHMPDESTVRGWAMDNVNGFYPQYARARDVALDHEADEIRDIADDLKDDPRSRAVRVDARKWRLSKMAPKRYGDRLAHEHSGTDGGPIQIVISADDSRL